MVDDKVVLITGSGSFAKAFANHLLLECKPKKVCFFSRDEYLQVLAREEVIDPRGLTRWFIGDVRDGDRLYKALKDVDVVIHTAALKRVEVCEYNPYEAVQTNIIGTQNVIDAAISRGVKKAIFLSTDKAVNAINLYGSTKAVAEKIWLDANYLTTSFSVVRYGNVMGSRGSVLPFYESLAKERKPFPVTDVRMTRFWVDMADAVRMVMEALEKPYGRIYVLKAPSFRIVDLAKALYARAEIKEVKKSPGEKYHEVLINEYEGERVTDCKWYYQINPEIVYREGDLVTVQQIGEYTSKDCTLSIKDIRNKL